MIGLSIDPGVSNGACLFQYDDEKPFERIAPIQFSGGAGGLADWMENYDMRIETDEVWLEDKKISALIVEKFTPRNDDSFNLTLDSVEPLRCEGVLIGKGFERFIRWTQPSQQYFMGSPDLELEEKKKAAVNFLKLHKLHLTGSMVGERNADDAISAQLHAIAWLRRKRHKPTMKYYFGSWD